MKYAYWFKKSDITDQIEIEDYLVISTNELLDNRQELKMGTITIQPNTGVSTPNKGTQEDITE